MSSNSTEKQIYNQAKVWQLALFALNNTATNLFMFLMGFVSYYATGVAGLAVVLISTILTAMRIFDGITDPIIGFVMDKTETKFGKFRPFMVFGNIILAVMAGIIYHTTASVPESFRIIYFIVIYAIYIIGYTFQTACTKAGQACLTNDPKQRPLFTMFDSVYNMILFTGLTVYVTNYLVAKHGGFNQSLFTEFYLFTIITSAVCTVLACIAISSKDRKEFFGIGENTVKIKFKDYLEVIKNNKAIQMLIVAASTDKLSLTVSGNASVSIMLYGIVVGNYALLGKMSFITMIPTFILIILGVQFARKFGQKKALVISTWLCLLTYGLMFLLLVLGDPTKISFENIGLMTVLFIVLTCLSKGVMGVSGGIVIPMIADCADYETYLSGRYVPGMMGTLFSFIDKLISSLATTIIGFAVASIGYTKTMPQPTDAYTPTIFWLTMFLFIGMPVLGWIASIIAMKFYPLDDVKMQEVQTKIRELKQIA